ncbi:amino acid permease [Ceraceosorus bombacis]|uniref:Amino acid permease n=1 Tax=Ceraceosorus bombacis TaxID=401625 RepID=A0A0P1BI28_9BASI|nr:amino acid permease [Ceraceosorus bombacis]
MGAFKNFLDSFKPETPGFGLEPQGPAVTDKHTGQVVTDEKASVGSGNGVNDYGSPEYANVQRVHMTPEGGAILTSDESGLKRNLTGRHMQIAGSFSAYSTRFIEPAWGFAMGWNYWAQWFVVLPLELVAASIVLQYWDPTYSHVPAGVYIMIFMIAIIIINLFGVRGYGEWEFFASSIKILAVLGFIILGAVITAGGAPDGRYRGGENWHNPGAFANGFQGFCSIFVTAAFAFAGTELVGLAAAETSNPRKEVPKACKQIFWRILVFYVVTLFLIGLIVPYTEPRLTSGATSYDARASPFVIAIEDAKIRGLPSVMNAVILISVLSVGNSAVFGASRTLCGLAQSGQAPKVFRYIDREGRPLPAVAVSLIFGALAFLVYAGEDANNTTFNWLLALSGLSSIFSWGSICLAHIRFRAAWARAGHTLEELPWTTPTGVYGSWFGFLFNILVLVFQAVKAAWPISPSDTPAGRASDFFQSYLAFPVVIVCYLVCKVVTKSRVIRIDEVDLSTGRRDPVPVQVLRAEREEAAAQPFYIKLYKFLCCELPLE